MGAVKLKSYEFRRERQKSWNELERLVKAVEKRGVRSLTAEELARLPVLYNAAVSSLSVARAISLDRNLLDYLESLAMRAYFCVYGAKRSLGEIVADFFVRRFPATVRLFKWHIALAGFFLLLGLASAFVLVGENPDWFYSFVPAGYASGRDPSATTEYLRSTLYDTDEEHTAGALGAFASFLFSHNAQVGIFAFALGFLAGVPVYILMFYNGLILGAFAAVFHSRGLSWDLWGWLLPHGVTELSAVVFCGGAGLVLAQALVFPGRHTRLRNLARRGRDAGVLVLGTVFMFLVAALIEGIFRQTVHSITVRYALAIGTALAGIAYFGWAGRRPA